jgi:hypothetical protein
MGGDEGRRGAAGRGKKHDSKNQHDREGEKRLSRHNSSDRQTRRSRIAAWPCRSGSLTRLETFFSLVACPMYQDGESSTFATNDVSYIALTFCLLRGMISRHDQALASKL